jgi:hypothetical protein
MAAPRKAQGNTTLSFNGHELKEWVKSVKVSADGKTIDVTALGDTAKAVIADTVEWSVVAEMNWDGTVDGYLFPEIITPGTKRTLIHTADDGTLVRTFTWTDQAEIQSINSDDSVGDVHKMSVTFSLSGAPGYGVA